MKQEIDNNTPQLPETKVPWWQDGKTIADKIKEPHYLTKGVHAFFAQVRDWLIYPLHQADAITCSEKILELKAWDKNIHRFEGEPMALYRKRVKYAAVNAKDSGSVAGFIRIFERLGIGIINFREREHPVDWDVCTIQVTDSDISKNSKLIKTLIEQYGRTCRRYRFEVTYPATVNIHHGEFSHTFCMYMASMDEPVTEVIIKPQPVHYAQQVFVATLGGTL